MPSLQGRVAVVTGAGRGLGREIARAFARAGARQILVARTESELLATADELTRIPSEVLAVQADVAIESDVARIVAASLERYGRIDILVNNAGLTPGAAGREISTILDVDAAFWDRLFATNCRGPFLTMKAIIPVMLRQGTGSIINISSALAHRAIPGNVPYGPSKAALEAMTLAVVSEFGARGIRANLLHPGGPAATSIFNDHYRPNPGSIVVPPDIIGPPAVWLASDESAGVQGQIVDARTWTPAGPGAGPAAG